MKGIAAQNVPRRPPPPSPNRSSAPRTPGDEYPPADLRDLLGEVRKASPADWPEPERGFYEWFLGVATDLPPDQARRIRQVFESGPSYPRARYGTFLPEVRAAREQFERRG